MAGHFCSCVDAQHGQELMKYTAGSEYQSTVLHEDETVAQRDKEVRGVNLDAGIERQARSTA